MKYRIGLDIGVASVGWAALECDEAGEPLRILNLGVRVFDAAEHPKTGASLAEPRRIARGTRRRLRRRAFRLQRIRALIAATFGEDVLQQAEENKDDLFALRVQGLDGVLTPVQLARLLVYFAKHRGFESNRKSGQSKEDGEVLKAIGENQKKIQEKGYRTVGEYIYCELVTFVDGRRVYETRNHEGKYGNCFLRADLKKEITLILQNQGYYNLINQDFIDRYLEIFSSQRSFDEGPGAPSPFRMENYAVGECDFEKGEIRAPKASYTFAYCSALQKINNLKIKLNGEERALTQEERELLIAQVKVKKELTYAQVKKLLKLDESARFNLLNYSSGKKKTPQETEKTKFISMEKSYSIRQALREENRANVALLDELANILSNCKTDKKRRERIACKPNVSAILSQEEIEKLLEIDCAQFGNLSLKAMQKLLPYLEEGCKYNYACERAGYDFRKHSGVEEKLIKLKGEKIKELVETITSPVARRAVSQTVKVINALIDRYGSPCGVNIELARELAKTKQERDQIKRENEQRESNYEKERQLLAGEYGIVNPSGMLVMKFRLYNEQGCKCAYSLKTLDLNRVLSDPTYVQIDHIIPYSRSYDDSWNNKVLVLADENQKKRNRLPYEYFGSDEERWNNYVAFVQSVIPSYRKRENLLRRTFGTDSEKEWKERALNDTKYISRFMLNLIQDYLYLEPIAGKKLQVQAVNGRITAYLRKFWNLNKIREDGDKHHAMDAAVIACVTPGIVQKINRFNKLKESHAIWDERNRCYRYTDADGVVYEEREYDMTFGGSDLHLEPPYTDFQRELRFRLMEDVQAHLESHLKMLLGLGYSDEEIDALKPIFVSRMPNRKADGEIHEATVRSARSLAEGVSAVKTPLTKLKLKNGEIEGYDERAKQDDRLLYEKLLARLIEFDGNAEKAFAEPFYKPKADGTDGNPVKKVWITTKFNAGFTFPHGKAVADNGSMVRIDVFYKDKKYYCVPVYVKDIYAKKLPNRAVVALKPYSEWTVIDSTYEFLFALYKNDLIYIKPNNPCVLSSCNKAEKQTVTMSEGYVYYGGFDSATAGIAFILHDNSYKGRVGSKTIPLIKKYTVDILGEIHEVKREKRQNTQWDS